MYALVPTGKGRSSLLLIVQATALGAVGDYFLTDRP